MAKKAFAAIALAILAIFALPAAANAAGYVPDSEIAVTGEIVAGGTVVVGFPDGSFIDGEQVSFAVTGEGTVTLAVVKAATVSLVKTADSSGAISVEVTLPENATGTYTVTATGLTSGNVATAALTVVAADAGGSGDDGLAETGYNAPILLIWAAAGALLLGIALVVVLSIVRRQRANA